MKILLLYIILSYSLNSQGYKYDDSEISSYGKRFKVSQSFYLESVSIKIFGQIDTKINVKVYGNQKQNQFLIYDNILFEGVIDVNDNGVQDISIEVNERIENQNNIFVIIENNNNENYVLSTKHSSYYCENIYNEVFTNNILYKKEEWQLALYDLSIDIKIKDYSELTEIFDDVVILDSIINKSLGICDLNNDDYLDILIDGNLLINNYSTFEKINIHNKDSLVSNFFLDVNNSGEKEIVLITFDTLNKKYNMLIKTYQFNEIKTIYEQEIDIEGFTNYNVIDFNSDGYQDLYINDIDNGDVILINDKFNNFENRTLEILKTEKKIYSKLIKKIDINNDNVIEYLSVGLNSYYIYSKDLNKYEIKDIGIGEMDYYSIPLVIHDENNTPNIYQVILDEREGVNYQNLYRINIDEDLNVVKEKINFNNDLIENYELIDLDNSNDYNKIYFASCDCRHTELEYKNQSNYMDLVSKNQSSLKHIFIAEDLNNDNKIDIIGFEENKLVVLYNKLDVKNHVVLEGKQMDKVSKIEYSINDRTYYRYNFNNKWFSLQTSDKIILSLGNNDEIDSLKLYDSSGHLIFNEYEILKSLILEVGNKVKKEAERTNEIQCKAYPQPFNTNIFFEIQNGKNQNVLISLYKSSGEKICEVYKGIISEDNQKIEFSDINIISELASGVYYYQIDHDDGILTGKLNRLK